MGWAKKWKNYPYGEFKYGMVRGGNGPKNAGYPSDGITYHTGGLPFWDWIENEDGTWCWLGRGTHGQCREDLTDLMNRSNDKE